MKMSNAFGYNPPGAIRNFEWLRCITYWAGGLGVAQGIIWMGLTITGILSYNCLLPAPGALSYGSVVQTVFYDLYFKGNCQPSVYEAYNATILLSVPIVQQPWQILVWNSVYLGVAVVWLLCSVVLLTHLKQDDLKATLVVLYAWITVTFCVCAMDLALGIIFGIDYGRFNIAAYSYNLNSANAGPILPDAVQLVAASVTSISMMIISLKGFVLWIINIGLGVYLLAQAINIASDQNYNDTLFMPRQETDDVLTTRPPIKAYEEITASPVGETNAAFVPDDRSLGTIELNQEAIVRAARMSTDATLQDRRFRNLDTFQQYPPPPARYNNARPESVQQDTVVTATVAVATFPVPDYSPPMSRANQGQSQNGQLRNQRYQ